MGIRWFYKMAGKSQTGSNRKKRMWLKSHGQNIWWQKQASRRRQNNANNNANIQTPVPSAWFGCRNPPAAMQKNQSTSSKSRRFSSDDLIDGLRAKGAPWWPWWVMPLLPRVIKPVTFKGPVERWFTHFAMGQERRPQITVHHNHSDRWGGGAHQAAHLVSAPVPVGDRNVEYGETCHLSEHSFLIARMRLVCLNRGRHILQSFLPPVADAGNLKTNTICSALCVWRRGYTCLNTCRAHIGNHHDLLVTNSAEPTNERPKRTLSEA